MGQPDQQQLTVNAGMSRPKRRRASQDSLLSHRDGAKRALYHCNYCQRDISATVRIKCAVCRDFDLCLGCFAAGAEVTPHKAHHDYRVVEEMSFPLNHPDWGADEELLLLEALDMYGLGNWGAVGDHVNREPAACAAHYEQIYLASPAFPQPTPAPEMDGVDPAEVMRERQRARQASCEPQSQPASPTAVDAGFVAAADPQQAAADGTAAADAGAAGAAAVSAGDRPEDKAAGAAGAVKQETEEAAAQRSGAEAADDGVAAAAEVPAAAAAGAAVKQEESATPPQAGDGQDTRALPKDKPHGANTPEQAAAVLARLEGGDAKQHNVDATEPAATGVVSAGGSGAPADDAATVHQQQTEAVTQPTAASNDAQPAPGAAAAEAAAAAPAAQAADSKAAAATEPGTPTDARAAKRRRLEAPDTAAGASAAGASAAAASPGGGAGAPGAKTAGSAGAKAKAKEDARAAAAAAGGGGDGSGSAAAASGPKPAHAELGGLRMGGGGGGDAAGAGGGTAAAKSERSAAQGGGGGSGGGHYKAKAKAGVLPDLTGFHAKRLEFEPEYDAEAEALLADLEFRESDTAAEVAAKLTLIAIYNERLTERKRRREFIQAHGLLDVKPQQAAERRWTSLEKEVHARTRAFARYMAPGAHHVLADGLILEQRLRGRIQELKELRAAGVRTFADAEQHEAEQRRAGVSSLGAPPRGTASDQQLRQWVPAASTPPQPGAASAAFAPGGGPGPADSRSLAVSLAAGRGRRGVQLDITNLPGLEALTSKERELAAGSRLLPPQVLNMAAGLLREAGRRGFISKAEARPFFRLEGARTLRLLDVLANAGWLQTTNPASSPAVTPGAKGAVGSEAAVPASAVLIASAAGGPAKPEGQ